MTSRILTAREQHAMLSPWRQTTAGRKKMLYRGLSLDLDHPELDAVKNLVHGGQWDHPELGNMILDHLDQRGIGKWWLPSQSPQALSMSRSYSRPRGVDSPANPLQVHLSGQWDEGSHLDPDEYEWEDYRPGDPQVVLAKGAPIHVYDVKIQHPSSGAGWHSVLHSPSVRTV